MTVRRFLPRLGLGAGVLLLGASAVLAVRRTEDPLALVPADAATVAMLRWSDLRSSSLGAQIFAQMDGVSTDGDASRFLRDTGLNPREDIDTMVLSMTRGSEGSDDVLVVFEGRFDPTRIGSALVSRHAVLQKGPNGSYYRLPAESSDHGRPGAVALVNPGLMLAGSESAVGAALGRKESGGAGGLMAGQGLGKQLSRVDPGASAWALVDLTRLPAAALGASRPSTGSDDDASRAVLGAMKSVSLVALQATVHGDSVDVSAFGLTGDAENRSLLQDSLRGVLAMWRLAIQDKSPDLVSVLRGFRIEDDGEGVSIKGTLPGSFFRQLSAHRPASGR
jgi:hypothetical protein